MEITNETVCLVTGASSGIGRALALRLAMRRARIGLVARRHEQLQETARMVEDLGGSALVLPCDVTVREEFQAAVEEVIRHYNQLDVLINNAGRGHFAYIEDTPEEHIENIFRVNVFSLWYGTAPALRHMRSRGRGHIVNIASMAGRIGFPANSAYVAAKHAVVGFNRALRAELVGTGIEATVVLPGGVRTDWAEVTEGGSMLELFAYEARRGAEIAREQGIVLPSPIPLLEAGEVAEMIMGALLDPVPELYTHPGSLELVRGYDSDPEEMERKLSPYWLANREKYMEQEKAES